MVIAPLELLREYLAGGVKEEGHENETRAKTSASKRTIFDMGIKIPALFLPPDNGARCGILVFCCK